MKAPLWVAAALIVVAALVAAFSHRDTQHNSDHSAHERELRQRLSISEAKLAEAKIEHRHADTVYLAARSRVVTLRDTINWHDTIQVLVYRERVDSALSACDALRRSCLVLSEAADSTIRVSQSATDWYRGEATRAKREARVWKIATVGAFLLGAWVRGQ